MQKLADAIEQIGRHVEALEKQAATAPVVPAAPTVEPATESTPTRNFGELLPKLAARLDLEEDAVKTELSKLSNSVLDELSKLANDEGNDTEISLGDVSDYVESSSAGRSKTANTSTGAWENFTKYLLDKR